MLRKPWIALAVVAAGVSFGIGSASAIEFGQPDNNKHPWVGLVVFFDAEDRPIQRCTGALLSPEHRTPAGKRLLLTSGHCAGPDGSSGSPQPSKARIWFSEGPIPCDPKYAEGNCAARASCAVGGPYTGYPCGGQDATGTPIAHPDWIRAGGVLVAPQTSDLGVVVIDSDPVASPRLPTTFGTLAPVGYLDQLATKRGLQDTQFEVVGYGAQSVKPVFVAIPQRLAAMVNLVSLGNATVRSWGVQISGNPGNGNGAGATCYGDSGGPLLHQTPAGQVIVAVISYVNSKNCTGTAGAYRVDTNYARDFIKDPAAPPKG